MVHIHNTRIVYNIGNLTYNKNTNYQTILTK